MPFGAHPMCVSIAQRLNSVQAQLTGAPDCPSLQGHAREEGLLRALRACGCDFVHVCTHVSLGRALCRSQPQGAPMMTRSSFACAAGQAAAFPKELCWLVGSERKVLPLFAGADPESHGHQRPTGL